MSPIIERKYPNGTTAYGIRWTDETGIGRKRFSKKWTKTQARAALARVEEQLACGIATRGTLARREGQVVTRKQVYRDVWGFAVMPRSTRTLESHVSRLRCKIAVVPETGITIGAVWGTGRRLTAGPP